MFEEEKLSSIKRQAPSLYQSGIPIPSDMPGSFHTSIPEFSDVSVGVSERHYDGKESYLRFPIYEGGRLLTYHRYSHFLWLRDQLVHNYSGCVLPSLPEKEGITSYWQPSNEHFQEYRQYGLEKFLNWIIRHTKLSKTDEFICFMKEDELNFSVRVRSTENRKGWIGTLINLSTAVKGTVTSTVSNYLYGEQMLIENELDSHFNRAKNELKELISHIEELEYQSFEFVSKLENEAASNTALSNAFDGLRKTDPNVCNIRTLADAHKEIAMIQQDSISKLNALFHKDLQNYKRMILGALEAIHRRNSIKLKSLQPAEEPVDIEEISSDLCRDLEWVNLERKQVHRELAMKYIILYQELRYNEGSAWSEVSEKVVIV